MKKSTKFLKKFVGIAAVKSAKLAAGSASLYGFCQPKEPFNLSKTLDGKKQWQNRERRGGDSSVLLKIDIKQEY